jgi:hypothetical protein
MCKQQQNRSPKLLKSHGETAHKSDPNLWVSGSVSVNRLKMTDVVEMTDKANPVGARGPYKKREAVVAQR